MVDVLYAPRLEMMSPSSSAVCKVLHVSPSFYPSKAYGGTIRSGYGLCRGLAQIGCDVRILTTDTDGLGRTLGVSNDREVEVDGLRVRYCHKRLRHSVSPALLTVLPSYIQWANIVHLTVVYSSPTFPPFSFVVCSTSRLCGLRGALCSDGRDPLEYFTSGSGNRYVRSWRLGTTWSYTSLHRQKPNKA
jgi:hypothetical protein